VQNQLFYSYTKFEIHSGDIKIIRKLYLPIIGPDAQSLYFQLDDLAFNSKNNANSIANNINNLFKSLNINLVEFNNARKKLEAVGLLKTFLSNDETKYAFEILAPLSAYKFLQNPLLKNLLQKQIGEIRLDNLMHFYKQTKMDLDDYVNVTASFTDLFDFETLPPSEVELTREMELPIVSSIDEAIEKLSSPLFFKYLTKEFPNSVQVNKLNTLLESGLPNASLNLLLNHSYKKNGAIIFNYINTIAIDFKKKNINTFIKIKDSLTYSLELTESIFFDKNEPTEIKEKSMRDIFKGMFSN
jgi:replication initiation and membrane attachment protein